MFDSEKYGSNLDWYEKFFMDNIDDGLVIVREKEDEYLFSLDEIKELSQEDIDILLTPIRVAEGEFSKELNEVFEKKFGGDFREKAKEWNEEMVSALQESFLDKKDSYDYDKSFGESVGVNIRPPEKRWREAYEELYKKSNKLLSAVVQNWYFSYGKEEL